MAVITFCFAASIICLVAGLISARTCCRLGKLSIDEIEEGPIYAAGTALFGVTTVFMMVGMIVSLYWGAEFLDAYHGTTVTTKPPAVAKQSEKTPDKPEKP